MTVRELSQLRYLKREIETERRRLLQLRARAEYAAPKNDGLPRRRGAADRVGACAVEIAYLEKLIGENMKRAVCELLRLQSFINEIPDSDTRQIFYLRYIKGKSWPAAAFILGLGEDTARKRHDKFLREGRSVRRSKRALRAGAAASGGEAAFKKSGPAVDIRELPIFTKEEKYCGEELSEKI
ncbi:MAG: hypothetical protein Q4B42_04955 [Oscillospiraceae bacterium]|nr:hypothetical protein [Oscillospiraceae bacterium]